VRQYKERCYFHNTALFFIYNIDYLSIGIVVISIALNRLSKYYAVKPVQFTTRKSAVLTSKIDKLFFGIDRIKALSKKVVHWL
jgi:hypothetical protein